MTASHRGGNTASCSIEGCCVHGGNTTSAKDGEKHGKHDRSKETSEVARDIIGIAEAPYRRSTSRVCFCRSCQNCSHARGRINPLTTCVLIGVSAIRSRFRVFPRKRRKYPESVPRCIVRTLICGDQAIGTRMVVRNRFRCPEEKMKWSPRFTACELEGTDPELWDGL